jgi:predicted membrane protein
MKRALLFLNLLDCNGNLSITNIAVIICLVKIATAAQFTGTEVGALIATLLNYAHKRFVNDGATS